MMVNNYRYLIFVICLRIDIVWLEECMERPVNIVIDSTNLTTRVDFEVFVDIVENVTSRLQGAYNNNNVSINVYPYNNNAPCHKLHNSCVRRSINASKPTRGKVTGYANLSSIPYRKYISQPFCLPCAQYLVKEHFMRQSGKGAFGLILTVYPSLKVFMHSGLHSRYKDNTSYVLALIYNSMNTTSNIPKRQPHTYARMATRSGELVEIILTFICPEKFDFRRSSPLRRNSNNQTMKTTESIPRTSPSGFGTDGINSNRSIEVGIGNSVTPLTQMDYLPTKPAVTQSVNTSTHIVIDELFLKNISKHENAKSVSSIKAHVTTTSDKRSMTVNDQLLLTPMHLSSLVNLTPASHTTTQMNKNETHKSGKTLITKLIVSSDVVPREDYTKYSSNTRISSSNISFYEVKARHTNNPTVLALKPSKTTSAFANYFSTPVLLKEGKENKNATTVIFAAKDIKSSSELVQSFTPGLSKETPKINFTNVLAVKHSSNRIKELSSRLNDSTVVGTLQYNSNATKVLSLEPSQSLSIQKPISLYATKDETLNELNYSKIVIFRTSLSSVILNASKYLTTLSVLVKTSMSTAKCANCSMLSMSASYSGIYHSKSSEALVVKPTSSIVINQITSAVIGNHSKIKDKPSNKTMLMSSDLRLSSACKLNPTIALTASHILRSSSTGTVISTNDLGNSSDAVIVKIPKRTKFLHGSSSVEVAKTHSSFSTQSAVINQSIRPSILSSYLLTNSLQSKLMAISVKVQLSDIKSSTSVIDSIPHMLTSKLSTLTSGSYDVSSFQSANIRMLSSGVTQLVYLSSLHNSLSLYYSSSSVFQIVKFNKVIDDITLFMEQNITLLHIKQKSWVKDFILNTSTLLNEIEENEHSLIHEKSLNFLSFVENTTLKIGNELPVGRNISLLTKDLKLEITAVDPEEFNGYTFSPEPTFQHKENVKLSSNLFKNTSIIQKKVSITTMFIKTIPAMRKTEGTFHDIGKVFTISLDVQLGTPMENILTYTFKVPRNNYSNYKCVYWNSTDWDTTGCRVANVSGTSVVCQCDHMTSFSILMQVSDFEIEEIHSYVLSMISYIGCSISIIGCVLLLLTYVMFGRLLKVSRNVIHMNLALAITISNALFISADAVHMYQTLCLTVSIAMLYSYLASFFWMLVEGIHVYLLIVKVFKSPNMMKVYIIIGWIVPAVIVAIAGLKFHVNFTRDDFCWISTEGNVIWVFVGPVLFIVVINGIILITALSTSYKMAVAETDFLRLQQIARLTMLLMPIFGLTWVFGLLAINKQLLIFQYVFTIINSLQGLYIFICYCLLNNEVKQEFERIRRKYQYDSGHTTSSDSHYSVYDQLFHRRLKSVVSIDSSTMVKLTKYDSKLNRYDSVKTESTRASSTYSDTLTKRLNKDYSIELINLNDGNNMSCINSDTQSMSSSVCPEEHDYGIKLNFEEVPLTNGHYSCGEFANDKCTYDTFKAKK